VFANFTLLTTGTVDVPANTLFFLDIPVTPTTIPAGSTIVVEVFTDTAGGTTFFAAGQPNGSSGISYIASDICGPEPADVVSIGFAASQWVMNISSTVTNIVEQTAGFPSGSFFPVGTTTNTFEITDANGNTTTESFDVTVTDDQAPVLVTQNITIDLDTTTAGQVFIGLDDVVVGIPSDNCGLESVTLSQDTFDCPTLGDVIITVDATDVNGNVTSNNVTITFIGSDKDLDGIANVCDDELNPAITPNLGISPNSDGQNDTWIIGNITDFPEALVQVFDRNGERVFNTTNYQNDWGGNRDGNGDLLPVGSYYYRVDVFNGHEQTLNLTGWLYINY
jgi:gliding motility-associated-like protein